MIKENQNSKNTASQGGQSANLCYTPCPNCGTLTLEKDYKASFRYVELIECPECIKKVKPNNVAKISDIPNMY